MPLHKYRIYSNKRPTSNQRPPRISANPKAEKVNKCPASNKPPPPPSPPPPPNQTQISVHPHPTHVSNNEIKIEIE